MTTVATASTVESAVLGTIVRYKFISPEEMSDRLDFTLKQIEEAVKSLQNKRKIVQSVPGFPKRYSITPAKKVKSTASYDDENEEDSYLNDYTVEVDQPPESIDVK